MARIRGRDLDRPAGRCGVRLRRRPEQRAGLQPADGASGEDHPGAGREGDPVRSAVASRGRTAEMLIECTGYDRPRLLASTTTMRQADISYTLTFEHDGAGTWMRWAGQVRPKGAFRLLGPLITWLGIRQERRIWASLKTHLETAPQLTA
jgi:polyketide cyclase/dehydrase/lipid transport protein